MLHTQRSWQEWQQILNYVLEGVGKEKKRALNLWEAIRILEYEKKYSLEEISLSILCSIIAIWQPLAVILTLLLQSSHCLVELHVFDACCLMQHLSQPLSLISLITLLIKSCSVFVKPYLLKSIFVSPFFRKI